VQPRLGAGVIKVDPEIRPATPGCSRLALDSACAVAGHGHWPQRRQDGSSFALRAAAPVVRCRSSAAGRWVCRRLPAAPQALALPLRRRSFIRGGGGLRTRLAPAIDSRKRARRRSAARRGPWQTCCGLLQAAIRVSATAGVRQSPSHDRERCRTGTPGIGRLE